MTALTFNWGKKIWGISANRHRLQYASTVCRVAMSKTKGQTFRYRFGNETKTFWYCSRISLIENRLFQFGPESDLLSLIKSIFFDITNSGKNSIVFFLSFLLDIGTFVERLLLYGFEITNVEHHYYLYCYEEGTDPERLWSHPADREEAASLRPVVKENVIT